MSATETGGRLGPLQAGARILVVSVLAAGIFALDRLSPWIAPGLFLAACVGLGVVVVAHFRAGPRDHPASARVDYARLNRINLAEGLPQLKAVVRGHDAVLDAIVAELGGRLRLARGGTTLGNYLLVGPTGTGKTYFGQRLAEVLYPQSQPVLLRMNQYKHPDDVFTLIGPPPGRPGYEVGGALTRPVLEDPCRVVILDELEKCHRDIQHCLYDILDAASCREKSSGQTVDFSACVFIGTCNAGVEELRGVKWLGADQATWTGRSRDVLVQAAGFDRAFLSRWTSIHLMDELPPLQVAEVACLELAKHWRAYGIELTYTAPEVILEAVQNNEEFKAYGVRQLGVYLQMKTDPAIVSARQGGLTKVWLGVTEAGELQVFQPPESS